MSPLLLTAIELALKANPSDIFWLIGYFRRYWHVGGATVDGGFATDIIGEIRKAIEWWAKANGITAEMSISQIVRLLQSRKRCAVQDAPEGTAAFGQQPKWTKRQLGFFVASYVDGIPPIAQVDMAMESFGKIAAVCGLTFHPAATAQTADLLIGTGRGPADNFDGPSGTLAWFYFPTGQDTQINGKLDLDELWSLRASPGTIPMDHVEPHEFCHGCGLPHTNVPNSLMNPFLGTVDRPQAWEIQQLQALYGQPEVHVPPAPAPAPAPAVPTVPNTPASPAVPGGSVDTYVTFPGGSIKFTGDVDVRVSRLASGAFTISPSPKMKPEDMSALNKLLLEMGR